MRILVEPPRATRPDPTVQGSALAVRVQLSPNVLHVKAGTPLAPGLTGWEIARGGADTILFAANAGRGGELVNVAREIALNLNQKLLLPCARYRLADVDDTGYPRFEPSVDGPYYALTDDCLLLTPDV